MQQLSESVDLVSFADVNDPEALAGFIKESGFPAIVKPKTSSGSRSIQIVQNEGQLKTALERNDSSIIQEYIDDAGGEFSVGVFVCDEFSSAIAFKRDLGPVGCSWYAETSYDKDVLDYAMNVARASHLRGSANVQLRNSSKGPRLLEINPRFSSLVAARAICGFLDLEWSIDIEFGWKPEITSQPYKKIRFRRYFQEAVDFCDGFMSVPEWSVNR
ncbi:MAG: ATP-grasp domain-containing protein [Deltaproteobacteria bacterium]|nr:ATP-grasp domain-containing protein [Candidatus Zymogenaceae bacterium]